MLHERSNPMNANSTMNSFPVLGVHIFGFLLIAAALALSLGVKLPFITNPRTVLIVFLAAGLVVCSIGGIGRVSASGAWLQPFSIIGYVLGALIIVIGVAALFGKPIPPLSSDQQSITAVAGIAALKLVLAAIHRLFL
jgi:hypothetical protein